MKEPNQPGARRSGATPNRGGNRQPPLIEGEAQDITPGGPAEEEAQSIAAGPLPDHEAEVHGTPTPVAGASGAESATPADAAAAEGALASDAVAGATVPPALDEEKPASTEPADKDRPASRASAPPPRPATGSRALPIAALVVSLLALAAAAAPWLADSGARDNTAAALADARQRLDAQDAKLAAQDKALQGYSALDNRLKALEAATKAQGGALDGLRADTRKALEAANAAQADAKRVATAAPAAAEAAPAPAPAAPVAAAVDLGPIQARLGDLDTRLTQTADAVAKNRDAIAVAADAAQKAQAAVAPLASLPQSLASLDQRLGGAEQKLESVANQSRVDAASIEKRTGTAVAAADSAARVVMAKALAQAIDTGRAYRPELSALAASGADPSRLAPLEAQADKGVPTAAALADSFSNLAGPILAGSETEAGGGLWDRLARGAGRLVRIRPVGDGGGDEPPAVVARMEAALARGDVAAALAARERLPEKAKAATDGWAKEARLRVEALAAADGLVDDATQRLARPRS